MTTVERTIAYETIETSHTVKISHDVGHGIVSQETEYKKEYPGRDGGVRDMAKPADKHNFGDLRDFEVIQKTHYNQVKGDPRVAELHENTTGLKLAIKTEGKFGHAFNAKEEHNKKYARPELKDDLPQRPGKWVKGNLNRPNLPFDPRTTTAQSYRGQSQEPAKKQDERFDNLKSPRNAKVRDHSAYSRDYNGKTPEKWKTDTLGEINKGADRLTASAIEDQCWKNKTLTSYTRDYSPNTRRPVSPNSQVYGKDTNMASLLNQFHNGYYVK
jgi:hypothetical protein